MIKQLGSSKDLTKEIIQVRFNHFQNRRKYLITKIAEEIKSKNIRYHHKNGKHSKKVKTRIFDDSFKITRGLTQNIN